MKRGRTNEPTPGYLRTNKWYEQNYNMSSTTISVWKGRGAPLDDVPAMKEWVARTVGNPHPNMRWPSAEATQPRAAPEPRQQSEMDGEMDESTEVGARVEIAALQQACRKMGMIYERNKDDEVLGEKYRKAWMDSLETLRKLEASTPKSELEDSKLVSIDKVEGALVKNLLELKTLIESIAQTVAMKLSHLEQEVIVEIEECIKDESAHVIRSMQEAKWIV